MREVLIFFVFVVSMFFVEELYAVGMGVGMRMKIGRQVRRILNVNHTKTNCVITPE